MKFSLKRPRENIQSAASSNLSHGCEFLDLPYLIPETTGILSGPKIYYLPVSFIEKTLDEQYIRGLEDKEWEYLSNLETDIRLWGLHRPGKLTISLTTVKLQDGNHRFICARRLGHTTFPVIIEYTEGQIKSGGIYIQKIIEELL